MIFQIAVTGSRTVTRGHNRLGRQHRDIADVWFFWLLAERNRETEQGNESKSKENVLHRAHSKAHNSSVTRISKKTSMPVEVFLFRRTSQLQTHQGRALKDVLLLYGILDYSEGCSSTTSQIGRFLPRSKLPILVCSSAPPSRIENTLRLCRGGPQLFIWR